MPMRPSTQVMPIVRILAGDAAESLEPVAAPCHGPLAVDAAGALQGRTTAAYPALELDVVAAGATFRKRRSDDRRDAAVRTCVAAPPGVDARVPPGTARESARQLMIGRPGVG
jgi:putative intracellular protease/amidase